jgi:transposase-like protein
MRRSRFSAEQIIGILREQEASGATAEVCRKHGISGAIFYKWKAKYGGLDVLGRAATEGARWRAALRYVGSPRRPPSVTLHWIGPARR